MKDTILAISGRPGLYRLLAQGHGNLIVENITDKKRMPIGGRSSVTSLNDISMYSEDDDVPLMEVLNNLKKAYEGKKMDLDHKKATDEELKEVMAKGLPNYDQDRVRISDMRKLVQWYNMLMVAGVVDFVEENDEAATEEVAEAAAE